MSHRHLGGHLHNQIAIYQVNTALPARLAAHAVYYVKTDAGRVLEYVTDGDAKAYLVDATTIVDTVETVGLLPDPNLFDAPRLMMVRAETVSGDGTSGVYWRRQTTATSGLWAWTQITGGSATSGTVIVNGAAGTLRKVHYQTAGVDRWLDGPGGTAETGNNAGSDWALNALADDGVTFRYNPISLHRQTGLAYPEPVSGNIKHAYWPRVQIKGFVNFTTAEPAAPADKDVWINTATGTGSATTSQVFTANAIVMRVGSAWVEIVPAAAGSFLAYNVATGVLHVFTGTAWTALGAGGGAGDVVGPATATDNAVARYDGATGKLLQSSGILITDTGLLGIGVSPVTDKIEIAGSAATGTGIDIQATGAIGTAEESAFVRFHNTNRRWILRVDGTDADKFQLRDVTAGGVRLSVDSAGNVGVGTVTPTAKLHVGGTAGTDGIRFPDGTLQTTAAATGAGTGDVVGPAAATDNALARFDTATGKLIQNSSVIVSDAGNVGIGTTPVTDKIEIAGSAATGTGIDIQATGTLGTAQESAFIRFHNTTRRWILRVDGTDADKLQFRDVTAGAVRMSIDASGNVGFGTVNPTAKIHVGGTAGVDGIRFPDGTLQTTAGGGATLQTYGTTRPASPTPGVTFVDITNPSLPEIDMAISDGTTTTWIQIA